MEKVDKFEEYKALNERTQKLSERRQTTTQTHLTIITAIFGTIAFLIKDSGLHNWMLVLASVPLLCIGIIACTIWLGITKKLEVFLDWQYDRLRDMEAGLPGSSMILTKENTHFCEPVEGGKKEVQFHITRSLAAAVADYSLWHLWRGNGHQRLLPLAVNQTGYVKQKRVAAQRRYSLFITASCINR